MFPGWLGRWEAGAIGMKVYHTGRQSSTRCCMRNALGTNFHSIKMQYSIYKGGKRSQRWHYCERMHELSRLTTDETRWSFRGLSLGVFAPAEKPHKHNYDAKLHTHEAVFA